MANWTVAGAGDNDHNGVYVEVGTWEDKACYYYSTGDKWLYWAADAGAWALAGGLGVDGPSTAYQGNGGATLPDNPWSAVTAAGPAPTVASGGTPAAPNEITVTVEITSHTEGDHISGIVEYEATITVDQPVVLHVNRTDVEGSVVVFSTQDVVFSATSLAQDLVFTEDLREYLRPGETERSHGFSVNVWGDYSGLIVFSDASEPHDGVNGLVVEAPAGEYLTDAPVVYITAPANGAEVSGTVTVAAWAESPSQESPDAIQSIELQIDGDMLQAWPFNFRGANVAYDLDTTQYDDGNHTLTVIATDGFGQTGSATVIVVIDNVAPGDTTDPVVTIIAPADGASVTRTIAVEATIVDAGGVDHAICYVDGASQGQLDASNTSGTWTWYIDSTGWTNATRTITVTAWDTSDNTGSDEIDLVFANTLPDQTKVLYTEQVPDGGIDIDFRSGAFLIGIAVPAINPDDLPTDAAQQCNLNVFAHVPGDSVDLEEYQLITPFRSHRFAVSGATIRWALQCVPRVVWSEWLTGSTACLRLGELDNGNVIGLCTGAAALVEISGGTLVEFADLSGLSPAPSDMVAVDGKVLVAYGDEIAVYDQDTGDLEFQITFTETVDTINHMVLGANDAVYIACTMDDTSGAIYSWSYPAFTEIATHTVGVNRLLFTGVELYSGDVSGVVHLVSGGALVEEYDTSETAITALGYNGETLYAGASAAGKMFRRVSTWSEVADLTWTQANTIAAFQGWTYLGGTDDELWREYPASDPVRITGAFGQPFTLADATAINDLFTTTDDEGNVALWLATSHGADARIYRLELGPAGDVVCGPEPPDVVFKILRDLS